VDVESAVAAGVVGVVWGVSDVVPSDGVPVSSFEASVGGASWRGRAVDVGFVSTPIVSETASSGALGMDTPGSVRGAIESFEISRLVVTSSADSCWPSPVI